MVEGVSARELRKREQDEKLVGLTVGLTPEQRAEYLFRGATLKGPLLEIAYVYVGVQGSRVKVGMTKHPEVRCKQLGATLVYAHPVVPSAAKLVETETLVKLGAPKRGREWVYHSQDVVIAAVKRAYEVVGRRYHVDPTVTADQARATRAAA